MNKKELYTEEKIVLWDYSYRNRSVTDVFQHDVLDRDDLWPVPDYEGLIAKGVPRKAAFWRFLIREAILEATVRSEKILPESVRSWRKKIDKLKTMDQVMEIVNNYRTLYLEDTFPKQLEADEDFLDAEVLMTCIDNYGSDEEMYDAGFAMSEETVRDYVESHIVVMRNGHDLIFMDSKSHSGNPIAKHKLADGSEEKVIIMSLKGHKDAVYEKDLYSVFQIVPGKHNQWQMTAKYNNLDRGEYYYKRLHPEGINLSREEAEGLRKKTIEKEFESELGKWFPISYIPEVRKAAEELMDMGFIKCTSAISGNTLIKQIRDTVEAFKELARILDISDRHALGNGLFALSFSPKSGVSGKLGDYYNGTIRVRSGSSALAHEWFHAVDIYFRNSMDIRKQNFDRISDMFSDAESDYYKRSLKCDRKAGNNKIYYSASHEMAARAFERYVSQKGHHPALVREEAEHDKFPYYPTSEEMEKYDALFDGLMKAVPDMSERSDIRIISDKETVEFEVNRLVEKLYKPMDYQYYSLDTVLMRSDRKNPFKGWEYLNSKTEWKYLTPELRKRTAEAKRIDSEKEFRKFCRKL